MIQRFKLLTFLGFFLFVFCLLNIALNVGLYFFKPQIHKLLEGKSVQVEGFEWGLGYWNGWDQVTLLDLDVRGLLLIEHDFSAPREFQAQVNRVDFRITSLREHEYELGFSGIQFIGGRFLDDEFPKNHYFERLDDGIITFTHAANSFFPRDVFLSVKKSVHELMKWLLREGDVFNVDFSGELTLLVNDFPAPLRFYTADKMGGGKKLMANKEDLFVVANRLEKKFTEEDVEVISHHVLRASRLIRFRDKALKLADEMVEEHPEITAEAVRHIFWSYFLARQYGSAFAKRVTDAHESGDEGARAEDQHMDYTNNERGRYYAEQGFSVGAVKAVLLRDKKVIKNIKHVEL